MVDVEPSPDGEPMELTPTGIFSAKFEELASHAAEIVTPISSGPRVDYERLNKAGAYIIKKLNEHESSEPFWYPVDERQVPHYRSVIKRPMDLDTIGRNLRAGMYGERQAGLIVDVRQMFKNCYIFNMEESAIYQHAKRLETYFERELLPEAVPEMAAVMGAPSAPSEPKAPIISVKIPTLTKSLAKKKEREKERARELQLLPTDWQACKKILTKLMQHSAAIWFLEPVDPIALGIPMYFDFVKRPMDLGTVSRRLEAYSYKTVVDFVDDVELVFRNSLSFNPVDSVVYQDTVTLAGVFDKTFVKPKIKEGKVPFTREPLPFKAAPEPAHIVKSTPVKPISIKIAPLKISLVQKPVQPPGPGADVLIGKVLKKVKAHKDAKIFLYPVDGSLYPDYYVKITQPMDLNAMTQKLERGGYQSTEDFVDDMQLMFKNCYTFNEPLSYGYVTGQSLEKYFKKEWDAATKKKK